MSKIGRGVPAQTSRVQMADTAQEEGLADLPILAPDCTRPLTGLRSEHESRESRVDAKLARPGKKPATDSDLTIVHTVRYAGQPIC